MRDARDDEVGFDDLEDDAPVAHSDPVMALPLLRSGLAPETLGQDSRRVITVSSRASIVGGNALISACASSAMTTRSVLTNID